MSTDKLVESKLGKGSEPDTFVVVDVGCIECGVSTELVGIYACEDEAHATAETRNAETGGWRNGGQTHAEVLAWTKGRCSE